MSNPSPRLAASLATAFLCALALSGCDPTGTGGLVVRASGEDGAQRGFPSTELVDGWSVSFDRYLVSLGNVVLTDGDREVTTGVFTPTVVDLHQGDVVLGELEALPAGRLGFHFEVLVPTADAEAGVGVLETDLEEMRQKGLTYLVSGTAVKPPYAPVTFRLGLAAPVKLRDCTNGVDGTQGVIIPVGSSAEAELTFHVEHLFFDRLGTHGDVHLRFEALAAMADAEGLVTLDQLAQQSVLSPVGLDGAPLTDDDGSAVIYDPGASSVQTLDAFLLRSARDQPHLNGGGLCTLVAP